MTWLWFVIAGIAVAILYVIRDDRWLSYVWRYRFRPGDLITLSKRDDYGCWETELQCTVNGVLRDEYVIEVCGTSCTKMSLRWLFAQVHQNNRRLVIQRTDGNGVQITHTFERWDPFMRY